MSAVKLLQEVINHGIGNPGYIEDAEKVLARLRFLERSHRLLRDEMRIMESAWRAAARGRTAGDIPTGPNFCNSMARAARFTLKDTNGRHAKRRQP